MRGRTLTIWFEVPWALAERNMSPDLLPNKGPAVRARLRFYDVEFESLHPRPGAQRGAGRFREAVIAFAGRAGEVEGEVSLFMWTDSDTYLAWGRELFGWPLLRNEIALSGALWERTVVEGAEGEARVDTPSGSAQVTEARVGAKGEPPSRPSVWLTPRSVFRRAGLDGEDRELLAVRATRRRPGACYAVACKVSIQFDAPHPLSGLSAIHFEDGIAGELIDGFEIVVGDNVELLDRS